MMHYNPLQNAALTCHMKAIQSTIITSESSVKMKLHVVLMEGGVTSF